MAMDPARGRSLIPPLKRLLGNGLRTHLKLAGFWPRIHVKVGVRDVITSLEARIMKIEQPARRRFFTTTAAGILLIATPRGAFAQTTTAPQQPAPKRPDPLAPGQVQEFVRKAHADLPGTKTMLAEQPSLLNATWDWGGGDFETGLGGAGHMGNREIAEYLIGEGARLDIFVAAMLGKIEIVRSLLTTWPALLHSKGPHGIPLMRHARAGGEQAKAVVEYLESLGA
jgi:hypothetical protein